MDRRDWVPLFSGVSVDSFRSTNPIERKCLDCSRSLRTRSLDAWETIRCVCGVAYSAELFRQSNTYVWELIRSKRLFQRNGDDLVVADISELRLNWKHE